MVQWREWCGAGEVAPVPGDTGDASVRVGPAVNEGGGPASGLVAGTGRAGCKVTLLIAKSRNRTWDSYANF